MTRLRPLLLVLIGLFTSMLAWPARAAGEEDPARTAALCLNAADRAERLADLPEGMVTGIMLAETGRWSRKHRRSYPWPWTVTSGKEAWYAPSREAAIATVRRLQAEGRRNIDVGCMQINLHWHPDAFRTIEEALDPIRNVAYGTAFLKELFDERGSWSRAVAAYHSRDPERGQAYLARVEKLQAQHRGWSQDELRTAFADPGREPAPASAGEPGDLRARALARGGVLLAALEAPEGVAVERAPGSLIPLRRDLPGSRIALAPSFLFSGTPAQQFYTASR